MKTKIKAGFIIGYEDGHHVILKDGELVYEGDSIIYVGHNFDGDVDETIDVGNSVVSPGFIDLNALGDIDRDIVHFEVEGKNQKSLLWSEAYALKGSHEVMTQEEENFKSLYAYTQLILSGVTTAMPITSVFCKKWAETYEEIEAAAHHAGKLGLRVYLGPSYQSGMTVVKPDGEVDIFWDEKAGEEGLERAVRFVKKFDGAYDGLIRGMLAPERIESQTEENLVNTKKYADELGCLIKLHAAQGLQEYNLLYAKYKKTPVRYLYDLGFLGKNVGIPHAHYTTGSSYIEGEGDDLALLKESGTTVIHCPLIIGKHSHALESFAKYRKRGINVALGTDTFPTDFFQIFRQGSALSKYINRDLDGSFYSDFFNAATLAGAKFLGRDDLGRLEVGAKADIIVIDLDGFHMGPIADPIRTMILSGSGRDVIMSIINGRIVMKDREIPGVDLKEVKERGQRHFDKLITGYAERDYRQLPSEELFKPSFEIVVNREVK